MAAAVVVPQTAAGDEDVDGAVVIVVAHRDWPVATDRVGGPCEAARTVVAEQAGGAGRARYEDVRTAIVVHIGERGIGPALDDAVFADKQDEGAVDVVVHVGER